MDTARYARQSDRELNPAFRRRWRDVSPPPTAAAIAAGDDDAEPGMATLIRWRDEWRQRRSKEARRTTGPSA